MTLRRAIVSFVVLFALVGASRAPTTHTVRRGQTLFSIARAYGVTVQRLAEANHITDPSRVAAGQRLVIPQTKGTDGRSGEKPPARARRPPAAVQRVPSSFSPEVHAVFRSLQWPVDGPVISKFAAPRRGQRRHKGLDIKSPEGAPVKAVADGLVVLAKDRHGAYGRLVVIDHGSGITSYYAHNSKNLVEMGQRVSTGDVIALVGRTGNASCDHLHFELRVEGAALDPGRHLPDPATAARVTTAALTPAAEPAARPGAGSETWPAADRRLYPPDPGKGPPPE
jgi:lipoprotein NlpD